MKIPTSIERLSPTSCSSLVTRLHKETRHNSIPIDSVMLCKDDLEIVILPVKDDTIIIPCV